MQPIDTVRGTFSSSAEQPQRQHSVIRSEGFAWWFICWLAFFAASVILYWPGLAAGYFSDDLMFFFNRPPASLLDYFLTKGLAIHTYRPLESIALTVIQGRFAFNTLPLRLLELAAHAGTVCVVLAAARLLKFQSSQAWLSAAFMLVAQACAPALLGNDTFSQSASGLFGSLSVLLLSIAFFATKHNKSSLFVGLSTISYFTSLFFKETALGWLLALGLLLLFASLQRATWPRRLQVLILTGLPYACLTALYLAMRLKAGGPLSSGGAYHMGIGVHILRNLAQFFLACLSPVSTVDLALAMQNDNYTPFVICGVFTLIVLIATAYGVVLAKQWRLASLLIALGIVALFPTYLLPHVSELYLYNALPFWTLILGCGLGWLWLQTSRLRIVAALCVVALVGGQIYAVREKSKLMTHNGELAASMLATLSGYIQSLPQGSEIFLVRPEERKPAYSVFVLNGIDVLDYGTHRISSILNRPDVKIQIIPETEARLRESHPQLVMLKPDADDRLQPYIGFTR